MTQALFRSAVTVSYHASVITITEQISKDSVMGRTARYCTVHDLVFMTLRDVGI